MYRGAYVGATPAEAAAALAAAHPTDELGAYASVIAAGDPSLYVWNGGAWADSGVAGVWLENVNGKTGPVVVLNYADVGAAPASHVADASVHVSAAERELLDGLPGELDALLGDIAGKVDKEAGKGLSSNDYTAAEKAKLAGVADGAEANQNAYSYVRVGNAWTSPRPGRRSPSSWRRGRTSRWRPTRRRGG
jgi:hypothetical protein